MTQPLPDWKTSTAGARVRVALWLATEIGVGGTFTKAQLRETFPAVEQIDRRMRDLRAEGWEIATNLQDRSLYPDELRLVTIGGAVWERGYRSKASTAISDKQRQAIFAADGHACGYCGITAGEPYPDDPVKTGKLTIARLQPPGGGAAKLQTVCGRCHSAVKNNTPDETLGADIAALTEEQRAQLGDWIARGRRPRPKTEQLWARYRRLPAEARAEIDSLFTR